MRVLPDNSFPAFFTPSQRGFVEAWYTLTNIQSLDSHRIRTLNARLALRELVDVCRLVEAEIIHASHRENVADEAAEILQEDPIYQSKFAPDWRVLRAVLHNPQFCRGDKAPRAIELRVTAEDSLVRANDQYFGFLIASLKESIDTAQPLQNIIQQTSALLTDLTDRGFSLANLYGFYKFFIVGTLDEHDNERTFDDRFRHLGLWLQRTGQPHEVVLRLSNARKLATLGRFGSWDFDQTLRQIDVGNQKETTFLRTGDEVVFAKTTVFARDYREAGTLALRLWSSVSDQLLFDFIRETLPHDTQYRCVRLQDGHVDMGLIQEHIPNPKEWALERHLREFSQQLDVALSSRCDLRDEDKRQIEAAMRYFRLGTESASLESAFLTRWIALESLLRTVHPDEAITGVCRCVSHLMAVTYFQRLNADLCATARFLRLPLPADIAIRVGRNDTGVIDPVQFAAELIDPVKRQPFVTLFAAWPLYALRLSEHGAALCDPKALEQLVVRHQEHVQWQIYRIYRVRNEIVHSAGHSVPLLSLVSHLEYYLKTTARTIVRLLGQAPHIGSLRDLFHRVSSRHTRLLEEFKAKQLPADLLDPKFTIER